MYPTHTAQSAYRPPIPISPEDIIEEGVRRLRNKGYSLEKARENAIKLREKIQAHLQQTNVRVTADGLRKLFLSKLDKFPGMNDNG